MSTPSKSRKTNTVSTGAQRIKAIVRRLPPNLPEDVFWKSCELWVNDNTIKEKWFIKGTLKGPRFSGSSLLSRAYIAFKSPEELATFSQNYDGHIFRDRQGNEFSAVVEFAASQKLPVANPKVDGRQGTIEDDEDFKNFLALLERGENPSKEKTVAQVVADSSKSESTPLLEALITSKKNASSAQGGKFSKNKAQHVSTPKPRNKDDDAHFSRSQPIVPSGPVTLLTPVKSESSSKAGVPPSNPTLSPALSAKMTVQAKETGSKGKGKGKNAAGESQDSPSKSGKGKNTPKKQAPATDTPANALVSMGEGSSKQNDDLSARPPPSSKKKKPSPSSGIDSTPSKNKDDGGETGDKGDDGPRTTVTRERGRGRGRGGGGRGTVVIVPKILTKIISEGSASAAKTPPLPLPPSSSVTAAVTKQETPEVSGTNGNDGEPVSSMSTVVSASTADPQTGGDRTESAAGSSPPPPPQQSGATPRGGERGRRPFYRGRGRGRGRGGVKATNAGNS